MTFLLGSVVDFRFLSRIFLDLLFFFLSIAAQLSLSDNWKVKSLQARIANRLILFLITNYWQFSRGICLILQTSIENFFIIVKIFL